MNYKFLLFVIFYNLVFYVLTNKWLYGTPVYKVFYFKMLYKEVIATNMNYKPLLFVAKFVLANR